MGGQRERERERKEKQGEGRWEREERGKEEQREETAPSDLSPFLGLGSGEGVLLRGGLRPLPLHGCT